MLINHVNEGVLEFDMETANFFAPRIDIFKKFQLEEYSHEDKVLLKMLRKLMQSMMSFST